MGLDLFLPFAGLTKHVEVDAQDFYVVCMFERSAFRVQWVLNHSVLLVRLRGNDREGCSLGGHL